MKREAQAYKERCSGGSSSAVPVFGACFGTRAAPTLNPLSVDNCSGTTVIEVKYENLYNDLLYAAGRPAGFRLIDRDNTSGSLLLFDMQLMRTVAILRSNASPAEIEDCLPLVLRLWRGFVLQYIGWQGVLQSWHGTNYYIALKERLFSLTSQQDLERFYASRL